MFKKNKVLKIIALILLVVIIGLGVVYKIMRNPMLYFNPAAVPSITASPMNISDIYEISYFRSNLGHDYSMNAWDGETCRSMKHYLNFNMNSEPNTNIPVRSKPTPNHPNIKIYAPFDGTIIDDEPEQMPIGHQIHISSAQNSHYFVRLFHIDLLPSLKVGDEVKSGQWIGTVGPMDGIDVSYEANLINGKTVYLSIFQYMTKEAFAPFAAKGYKPSDFILTKEQADAKGYECNGQYFSNAPQQDPGAPVQEGAVMLRPNPYAAIFDQQHSQ